MVGGSTSNHSRPKQSFTAGQTLQLLGSKACRVQVFPSGDDRLDYHRHLSDRAGGNSAQVGAVAAGEGQEPRDGDVRDEHCKHYFRH